MAALHPFFFFSLSFSVFLPSVFSVPLWFGKQSMPELPPPKRQPSIQSPSVSRRGAVRYAELHCRTNFSFLEGASHPDELVARAAELGHAALAVTDRNNLAGVVRAHGAAKSLSQNSRGLSPFAESAEQKGTGHFPAAGFATGSNAAG